ncbi:pyocin knob domain-containing protein [Pseudomonas brassicacearum]|uniref:pyocin knob domain-containing protein n=1 Tax=Pseudomonas brassicacearum TaxID=930166 RepID=UPI00067BD23A|nr:pyocin knob domain-containing protein [Pseudomonas brassicacearum]
MPWYKQGTCNVTLNSNAVTGTGTAFIVNARVGDAFRGPDGRWYEVTNVASNTAISIDPPYIGATASAGSYALAPMQGYLKDSADALRAIVNTYGAQLAALKTTGNYDVLPVTKGGTGGTTQADGRTGLGLGSAATATVTTSTTDTTAGRLLKYADFGIGTPIVLPGSADLNTYLTGGLYYCSSPVNGPGGNGWLNVYPLNSTFAVQEFTNVATKAKFIRLLSSGTFGGWDRLLTSAEVVGTGNILARSDLVGTVAQASGVPTGSAMQKIVNSAGETHRFASGLQICFGKAAFSAQTWSAGTGVRYLNVNISLPSAFSAQPKITATLQDNDISGRSAWVTNCTSTTPFSTASTWVAATATSTGAGPFAIDFIAVGSWY